MRPGRFLSATIWLLVILATAGTAAAQAPFAGAWKLNQDKSQLAGDTLKFGPAHGDAIELKAGGVTYSFRADGKNYAMPTGNMAIWRETSPTSWTTEYRKPDGSLLSRDSWQLSTDGQKLSVTTSGVKADGDLYTNTAEYVRTAGPEVRPALSGESRLMGAWKSTDVKLSSPDEFSIEELGLDKLVLKVPAMKVSCEITSDGKEVAVEGPDIPSGLRIALTRTGPYTFKLVQKLNGSVISTSVYTVAEDRETMTEVGGAPGDPPSTMVWERQAPAVVAAPPQRPKEANPPAGVH
jgi:hypothetical protein